MSGAVVHTNDHLFVDEWVFTPSAPAGVRKRLPTGRTIAAFFAGVALTMTVGAITMRSQAGDEQTKVLGVTKAAEGRALRYTFALGDGPGASSLRFRTPSGGIPVLEGSRGSFTATVGFEVVRLRRDRSALIEMTVESANASPDFASTFDGSTLLVDITPDSSVSSIEGAGGAFDGDRIEALGEQVLFPNAGTGDLQDGDTWSQDLRISIVAEAPATDERAAPA